MLPPVCPDLKKIIFKILGVIFQLQGASILDVVQNGFSLHVFMLEHGTISRFSEQYWLKRMFFKLKYVIMFNFVGISIPMLWCTIWFF